MPQKEQSQHSSSITKKEEKNSKKKNQISITKKSFEWNALSDEKKKPYVAKAEADKKRYEAEKKAYDAKKKGKK